MSESKLKVGASKRCIDPPENMYPIMGMFDDVMADARYDECNCRALAIDSCGEKILMLCYDLAHPPVLDGFIKELSQATGVPENRIFISATHNHTSPGVEMPMLENPTEYVKTIQKILHDQGLAAAEEAVDKMRPAKYAYGEIDSYINTNRYLHTMCGYWVEAMNLSGYSDKTLAMIKFVDMEGNLIAAFLNHATHAVCALGTRDVDHKTKTSGNLPGIACNFVETHYGNGAVAFWTSGAAGDQNPIYAHGIQYEYPDGYTTSMSYPDGVEFMQMESLGRQHGVDCVRGLDAITEYSEEMPIQYSETKVNLPARYRKENNHEKMMPGFANERQGANGPRPLDLPYGTLAQAGEFPEMEEDPNRPAVLEMRLLMLGDIALLYTNAELFSLLGKDMKELSPYPKTVLVTQTGKNEIGYIFDKTSKDILVPMAFQCVIPGRCDDLVLGAEKTVLEQIESEKFDKT